MSNLDNIINKTKNLMGVASKKTGEIFEFSKLKIDKINKSAELQKNYEILGRWIYSEAKSNIFSCDEKEFVTMTDNIKTIIEKIKKIESEITELTNDLVIMKNIKICPNCGNKNNKKSLYCSLCGNQLLDDFDGANYQKFSVKKDYITNDISETSINVDDGFENNVEALSNISEHQNEDITSENLNAKADLHLDAE